MCAFLRVELEYLPLFVYFKSFDSSFLRLISAYSPNKNPLPFNGGIYFGNSPFVFVFCLFLRGFLCVELLLS